MQTNLFTKEKINQESSVGEFYKGHVRHDSLSKLYFSYPKVETIYLKVKKALEENKKVIFKTRKAIKNDELINTNFLKDHPVSKKLEDGIPTSHFGSLLTPSFAGQKTLGNYSLAFIEAKVSKLYHEHFHKGAAIDHFHSVQGVCNIGIFADLIKAFDIKKNEVVTLLTPANAIKAFKENKYSAWKSLKTETDLDSNDEIYLINKVDHSTKASIKLVSEKITNLNSPIYKMKIDDRWAIVVPWQINSKNLRENVSLEVTNGLFENLKNNKTLDQGDFNDEIEIEASLGQAVRVIFELLDGDYDNIPEAMPNFEGGSWSSIALENSSTGRHQGSNSMHEVLENKWYENNNIAIPWNYLGFDRLSSSNRDLIDDENVYVLSFEDNAERVDNKVCFLEANQSWKKLVTEAVTYITKFAYREYSAIASKKFLLSTKEIMSIAALFLANWSIHDYSTSSNGYKAKLKELNIPEELHDLLEAIAYTHVLLNAKADFHSCKTSPDNIARLRCIAKIEKKLEKLCPISIKNFKQKIQALFTKDTKTEMTTLWQLYQTELSKI